MSEEQPPAKTGSSRREFLVQSSALALWGPLVGATLTAFPAWAKKQAKNSDVISSTDVSSLPLRRMTFGPRPQDFADFAKLGRTPAQQIQKYLEKQLHPQQIPDPVLEAKLTAAKLTTLQKTYSNLWKEHVLAADQIREAQKAPAVPGTSPMTMVSENQLRLQPLNELEQATWLRMVYSERQLQEVMTHFWHNHFNVYAWEPQIAPLFVQLDQDVIRPQVFGNFRMLLEGVAKSPAMLTYLDNFLNQSGNPNENYARELFELHTLGAENYLGTESRERVPGFGHGQPVGYVDGDVYEAARCFTGWKIDSGAKSTNTGEFIYFEPWHDRFQKIVLGRHLKEYQGPLRDGHDVLDILADHPGTARFVTRKLCRRLMCDNPPEAFVKKIADVFHQQRKAPDQLAQVIRAILLSPEFAHNTQPKIKRPIEFTAGLLRSAGIDFYPSDPFLRNFEKMGQRLFQWRTPDGYPDQVQKILGANSVLERWRIVDLILVNGVEGSQWNEGDFLRRHGVELEASSASDLLLHFQQLNTKVFGQSLNVTTLQEVSEFLASAKTQKLPKAVSASLALLWMSPEAQWS